MSLGSRRHRSFTNADVIDAAFFQQDHHVFHYPGGRYDPVFGKICGLGPEDDVGFDKHFRIAKAGDPGRGRVQRLF